MRSRWYSAARMADVVSIAVYTSAWLCGSLLSGPPRDAPCDSMIPASASTTGAYARRSTHGPVWPYPEIDA